MAEMIQSDFEVIRRRKVYEAVAEQIERLILRKLKPGNKLPSERELADMLQVSRSSIRDAIRSLELEQGLLGDDYLRFGGRVYGLAMAEAPVCSRCERV